jgi:hypothetical protein
VGALVLLVALFVAYKRKCSTVAPKKDDDLNNDGIRVVQVQSANTNTNTNSIATTANTSDNISSPHKVALPFSGRLRHQVNGVDELNQHQIAFEGHSDTNQASKKNNHKNSKSNNSLTHDYRQTVSKIMDFDDNQHQDDDDDIPVLISSSDNLKEAAFISTSNNMSNLPMHAKPLNEVGAPATQFRDISGDKVDGTHPFSSSNGQIGVIASSGTAKETGLYGLPSQTRNNVAISKLVDFDDDEEVI